MSTTPYGVPTERGACPLDPPARLGELRADEPVTPLVFPGDDHTGWLVTGHAATRQVLADARFSSRGELARVPIDIGHRRGSATVPPGMFSRLDDPEHGHYRRQLTGQFTVRRMRLLRDRIVEITEEHLDALTQAGPPADLVRDFALPIPSLVICELLGVPYAERDRFQRATAAVFHSDSTPEQRSAAWGDINGFITESIHRKRREPSDDLLGDLVAAAELTDEELANIGVMLLVAGHETTANMLALGTYALLTHPEQADRLRREPELVDNAVEELLRYLSVVHVGPTRTALADVEVAGRLIRAGDSVAVSVPAANRDPAKFPDPDRLDLGRKATGHVAFGHGAHQCLGQQLARMEMRVGYPALLRRLPKLRLAVPEARLRWRGDTAVYGLYELPVTW